MFPRQVPSSPRPFSRRGPRAAAGPSRFPGLELQAPVLLGPPASRLRTPRSRDRPGPAYPIGVLREPVHLLRPPRHGCSLRAGGRGRTRPGLVAARLREAGAPVRLRGPRRSTAATAVGPGVPARCSAAKMSKVVALPLPLPLPPPPVRN